MTRSVHPAYPTHSPAIADAAVAVVAVESIDSRSTGVVTVKLRLVDGRVVSVVIDKSSVSTGYVTFAAAAIAQIALVQRGIL